MAKKPIKSINLLPEFLRTDKNSKFLSSTIDQLIQPAELERLDGFIGSKLTPTYISTSDVYVAESLSLRRDYQLEPALVVKDDLGNVEQVKAIDDLANEITTEGGFNNDFDRLFRSDFYSFNPHIDFDKFVNYQKYYWLVSGPDTITITGKQLNSTSTYTVSDNEIKSAWVFSPDGLTEDPTVVLYRGNTYNFVVDSDYKFFIKTAPSLGTDDVYNVNVTGNGVKRGQVTITVNENTPSTLYYTSDNVNYVQGKFVIKQATEDAYINVDQEIVGKKNYTSGTRLTLSNGMKVRFGGEIFPETYKDKEYFVEGVGKAIQLVDISLLSNSEKLAAQFDDDFDVTNFDQYPYDNFKQLPLTPEYLTINRGSKDLNPWSRYNRWVHEDVILITARTNGTQAVIPASSRAQRPIIEFVSDLQLYNFGSVGIRNIDLIDTETLDAFSMIEGSAGYHIDGVLLEQGHRVVFNADTDDLVRGKIYEVNFLTINGRPRIELKATADHIPTIGASLSTNLGTTTAGKSWWFNGDAWQFAQQHETRNQTPLFDLFDANGISYSSSSYDTDFKGSKVFSYEVGTGNPDSVLGFPLSYQNTISVGSYKFKNYFSTDTISIFENNQVTKLSTEIAYLKINDTADSRFANVWTQAEPYEIPILQLYSTTESTLSVEVNAIDNPDTTNFVLQVYINGNKLSQDKWYLTTSPSKCFVNFYTALNSGTNVLFKIFTRALANSNGQYETPISLTNNPLNGPIGTMTLTAVSDHLKTMTERSPEFVGSALGSNNVRDLPDIVKYGTRLISNANPIAFANFFLGIKEHDAVDAIQKSADQYYQFKLSFLRKLTEIGDIRDPIAAVDNVMTAINNDKDLNSPWYYSDMIAYGTDRTTRTWVTTDSRNTIYPITNDFDPTKIGLRSVLVYLNGKQLTLGTDYQFLINDSSIELLTEFSAGNELRVDDYFSTEGSYIPATPSKLGLFPKYRPNIYVDETYTTPTKVIQGHDGSIIVAFDDFRDDIILELEMRIYNNIKVQYRPELFDVNKVLPGAFRENDYSLDEVNTILQTDFIRWAGFYSVDYIPNATFDLANPFTWNYTGGYNVITDKAVSGYWRSFFKYFYDTDRPNTHPWEMLGFSEKPMWWESEYGPAPYTSGNSVLWSDLEQGLIRQGSRAGVDEMYARTGLTQMIPVDEFGNIVDPSQALITNITPYNIRQSWIFGDQGPAETAWRRSSYWPFAVQRLMALAKPASYSSLLYDTSRVNKNIAGQWTYGDKKEFLDPRLIEVYGLDRTLTSGYSVYVSEIGSQRSSSYLTMLKNDLAYLDFNLFHKAGGFVNKNKLQIIIDAIEPNSTSPGALLPQESYKLILNVSNPIKSAGISGAIVQKSNGKFVVKGYDKYKPYFTVLTPKRNSTTPAITVGGVSESFVDWNAGETGGDTGLSAADTTTASAAATGSFYRQGQIVRYRQRYYRTTVSHRASTTFNTAYFQSLNSLPIVGGVSVQIANGFNLNPVRVPYGTEFDRIQDLYDMLVGYGKWLESEGFIFDEYNKDLNELVDWSLSAKEFLYWTTQNWAENSIITLSPFANRVKYTLPSSVVDNIFDNFYEYSLLKADGLPFPEKSLNVNRDDGICTIETISTTEGIYFAELHSVQKEHAMVFDNTTIFNDTIYDIETGYRQLRMKLVGFRTSNWNGDYFSPGFVYDRAEVSDWKKYTTYLYGDTVRYSGNYYSAKQNVPSATEFDFNGWVLLNEKPQPDLIPNFEYKINQFEDFYSLDIDNFDAAQQKMAQHLIGYTPRVYLNNIFTNPISQYKFYQGFIKEKGSRNAIKRLAKASIFNLQGETDYTEEWALRLGQYGSYPSYEEIEISLEEGSFIENPQIVNFVAAKPVNPNDLIYYSTASNIAILPDDYNPLSTFATTSTNNFRLPNAGYVSFEDITATAYSENSLLDIANANQISKGDVIWLGFKSNGSWDVLRYDLSDSRIVGVFVSAPGAEITFVTDLFHGLSLGDVISITRFNDQVNGVYIVKGIPKLNQITVSSILVSITNDELLSPGLLYKFTGARTPSFDKLPSDSQMLRTPIGSKFWIDNEIADGTFNWEVYEKISNYSNRKIQSEFDTVSDQEIGFSIAKKEDSNVVLVGAPGFNTNVDNGRVFVFVKNRDSSARLLNYSLNNFKDQYHSSTSTTEFGYALTYSSNTFAGTDYGLMYAGAPATSNILTTGTILRYADEGADVALATHAGAVKISSIDPVTTYERTEIVLVSPGYSNYERFGASLSVNGPNNNLYVGAPGTRTTGTGVFYIYQTLAPDVGVIVASTATIGTSEIYINSTASIAVGQTVWVPGVLNDIVGGYKVDTIYDDGLTQYVVLNQPLPANIPAESFVKFYTTSSLITSSNVYTSTNGLLIALTDTVTAQAPTVGAEYGYAIDSSADGKIVVVSAPGRNYVETFINIGSPGVIRAVHTSTFTSNTGTRFGESVAMSAGGEYMFVGAPYVKNDDDSFGKVAVYRRNGNTFTYTTSISNPVAGAAMNFGQEIAINASTNTLVISSIGLNKSVPVAFDLETTNFDSNSTFFYDTIENFGTVYVYNRDQAATRFVLSAELIPPIGVGLVGTNFGYSLAVDNDTVFAGAPSIDAVTTSSFYQFTKIDSSKNSLDLYKSYGDTVDIDTIQKIRLINTFNETVVDYLDVIDPIKGKISGLAEQELKYKSAYDPAIYSIGTAGVVVDTDTSWLDQHVGELWWDLSTVKYVWYEQGELTYRKNNWGSIFPGAMIDVYEWVGSNYLPSEWSSLADTSAGLTEGISGQPKYVDNSSISVKQVYNSVSNSFRNVYYYWVKNKVIIPNTRNRRISAYQVASIIADPTSYGLKYAAILSNDAIALSNVGPLLVDNRIHLNIAYDNIKNTVPKHTEWSLIEEGSANSMPPALYEKKLFDSLLGRDSLGNIVPDPALTDRTRYGISIRPRQTIFKDRRAALRELIEFSNSVLIENQITGSYSFRNLNAQEAPPDEFSREYDQIVEDNEGLNIVDNRHLEQASLTCTVLNGKIRSVSITKPGLGYKIPPNVVIGSGGNGARIETEIDSFGRVTSATIIESGQGYESAPILTVRPYSVIVLADNLFNGKWTKFEWNRLTRQWERKQTQKYNTTLYWNYTNWSSPTYNEFIDYSYTVDQVYQLDTLEDLIQGQYVKVKNAGDGRYIIVEKADDSELGTFGKGFNLVYSQNGTIQISNNIWDVRDSTLGYDQDNNYDQTLYDQAADLELEFILSALKNDIFINELKVNWNLFFFKAIKYALTEQKLLDWAFKTSFINVTNYAGVLDQRPVYKLQTSENYEDYIKEVKPYHTQIRTFTANHQIVDPSNSFITDFDLPSYYNQNSNQFENVDQGNPLLDQQPWKAWNDNYLYTVGNIVVGSGGGAYTYPPQVTIESAPGDTGHGAIARAYISSGKVSKIEVINPGSSYKISPKIILTGGGDTNLVPAVAYAQLYNGKVRTNQIGIKFDRISISSTIGDRPVEDSYVCDGSAAEFVLSWFVDPDKSKMTVTLDGDLVLSSDYRIDSYKEIYNGYNKDFSKVTFVNGVPLYGQILRVEYLKNVNLFNAAERIIEFYTATSGMPGKELPQLMSGIEYPGISVQGLPFDYTTNWDISYSPFGKSSYSDNISYYTKVGVASTATTGANTAILSTMTGIVIGQLANVISTVTNKFYETEVYVTGTNTSTNVVFFSSTLTGNLEPGDVIEFWNYDANATILDSAIEGGSFVAGAQGINPEDIIIDGDGFITPNTSYGPEELVPGETHDTLGINVYTRFNEGAPTIYNGLIDIYRGVVTSATLSFVPPNIASIFVTFAGRNFSYTTDDQHLIDIDIPKFSYDWATNKIYIGPQTEQGKLGYTIVSIGGGRPNKEAGVIDRGFAVVNDGSVEAEVISMSAIGTVKSAYVTVNGISIPKLSTANTTTLGYMLITSEIEPKRAAAHVYNISTSTTSTVQAWFFGTANKYFNEFKEQIFEIGLDFADTFILDQPPGNIEPAAANIIVEVDQGSGYKRYQPPYISYYKVDPSVLVYKIENNIDHGPEYFGQDGTRVYLNGRKLTVGIDYYFNYDDQAVEIRNGVLATDDVLAVLGIPRVRTVGPFVDFDVEGNTLRLLTPISNALLKVTTFTNHDDMMVRTETFQGDLNRRFKVSRPIINRNYLWVVVDETLLVNGIDYTVLDDARTVELSDKFYLNSTNLVVITTISSNQLADTVIGYRIFNDIFNRTHYKRLAKTNTTVLTQPLYFTDTEIHVADTSVLMPPLIAKKIPGVILINNERIEYFKVEGNTLKQLRRSTLGTSPSFYLPEGTKLIDQSPEQTVPFVDRYYKQTVLTSSTTATYSISALDIITTTTVAGDQVLSNGIILSTTSTVNPVDQIEVYYGGRKLRKAGSYQHDTTVSFDSPAANIVGFTSTVASLPTTDIMNTAYVVAETNQVWVYTNSIEQDAVNGYVYKGLNYLEPEFNLTLSVNEGVAANLAALSNLISNAELPQDNKFDINGDGIVNDTDVSIYRSLSNSESINTATVLTSGTNYSSSTLITFSSPDVVGGVTATGYVSVINGNIVDVVLTNLGSGYKKSPTVLTGITYIATGTTSTTTLYINTSNLYVGMTVTGTNISTSTNILGISSGTILLSTSTLNTLSNFNDVLTLLDTGTGATFSVGLTISTGTYVSYVMNENSNYGTLLNQHITLNIANGVQDNVRLTIVKRGFEKDNIWNDQNSSSATKSLLESTTMPARFLQAKLAELPDVNYYGESTALNINSGLALTDENNEPLEGL
jgi:hypothetical protein